MINPINGQVTLDLNEIFNQGSSINNVGYPLGDALRDLIAASNVSSVPSKSLYVDGGRSDTYIENGSRVNPFKTIQAAINQIIVNNDNITYAYSIHMASWLYPETITLEDLKLYRIDLVGEGIVRVNPATGNALQSTTLNTNLVDFHCKNIIFSKPFVVTGSNGSAAFSDVWHTNCSFVDTGDITITCANNFGLRGCYSERPIILNNVNYQYHESSHLQGAMTHNFDSTADLPSLGLQV